MAVKSDPTSGAMGAGKRFAIGANVALSIVVAAGLLIAVNVLAAYGHVRKDLASVNNYGLSDRTRHILDDASGNIELSIVYEPNDKDEKQRGYIDRLQDYCDELSTYGKKVKVTHVATDRQREQLVADIGGSVAGEADKHREAMDAFERLRADLEAELGQRAAEAAAIQSNQNAWLSGFPLFTQVTLKLQDMHDKVVDVKSDIKELMPEGGVPKYGQAATIAKTELDQLKGGFESIAKLMDRFTSLANETTQANSQYVSMLREVSAAAQGIGDKLRSAVGEEGSELPEDMKTPLKNFADACVEVSGTLDGLVARVNRFADAFPIVRQHADWTAQVQSGPLPLQIEVGGVIQEISRSLEKMRLQVLGILDKSDPNELQAALIGVRRNTSSIEQNIGVVEDILKSLAKSLSTMDPQSKSLLDAARNGGLFATALKSIDEVKTKFDNLPELTLGDIADKLREPNTIVVKVGKKLRVIPFDEAWPIQANMPTLEKEEPLRTFNGDSAISSAILALTAPKKFANVVFVGYEPPAPQQRSPFMPPPPRSTIPLAQTSEVRERLMASNYNTYQWNMAEEPDVPTVEEGLRTIYVFLPPAPAAMPNPFGPQTPQKSFGEPEQAKIRSLLSAGSRAIFLAGWEVTSSPMSGQPITPEYGYNPILESEFGLHVDNGTRVIKVDMDTKSERGFTVRGQDLQWTPLIGYSDQPIGQSMKGTRSLAQNVCIIEARNPAGDADVSCEPVLRIPDRETYIGAPLTELMKIAAAINDPRGKGVIQLENRPETDADVRIVDDGNGHVSMRLGFVPPSNANSAMFTVNGFKFRAPIESAPSHWLDIPASALSDAGVKAGDSVELKLTLPKPNDKTQKTIKTTVEADAPYHIVIPGATMDDIGRYVSDDELPVRVTVNKKQFSTTLRTKDGDSWIPLSESDRSAAGLEVGGSADVVLRIAGIHDAYYPEISFAGNVAKVENPGFRARLDFNPMAGAMLPNQVLKASIKGHEFNATAFEIGGEYRAPIYGMDKSRLAVKAGDSVRAHIELITGEEPSPFDLIVAATRKTAGGAKDATSQESADKSAKDTKIVLMTIGQSFIDAYLNQSVLASLEPIRLDPPPTENLDLFVNSIDWLNDTPEYIARGPAPVPRIEAIPAGQKAVLRGVLLGAWPALILAIGVVLWFMRRR